jgi:thiol-disulfide isomerase/thioredoxin
VSCSPVDEKALDPSQQYLDSWSELAGLIRKGRSFSGKERNCCFLNTRGRRFADVSAATGLDHIDDGRTVALVDWDHDGDLDVWLANRTGPRIRFLRNDVPTSHHWISLRLVGDPEQGTNRDAIGARVQITLDGDTPRTLHRSLRAGEGYLSQSSKWVHFGLGDATKITRLTVRWPGPGKVESFEGARLDARMRAVQGTGRVETVGATQRSLSLTPSDVEPTPSSKTARVRFAERRPISSGLEFKRLDGSDGDARPSGGPVLVNLWATWCLPCVRELRDFGEHAERISSAGLRVVPLNVDSMDGSGKPDPEKARGVLERLGVSFAEAGMATREIVDVLDKAQRTAIYRQRQVSLPSSFLIDAQGRLAVVYKGAVSIDSLLEDVRSLDAVQKDAFDRAAPFAGRWSREHFKLHPPAIADVYLRGGYPEDAIDYLVVQLAKEDKGLAAESVPAEVLNAKKRVADLHLALANARLRTGDGLKAVESLRAVLDVLPGDVRAAVFLAQVLASHHDAALRDGAEAVRIALQACETSRNQHIPALDVLGAAYAESGDFDKAIESVQRAIALAQSKGQQRLVGSLNGRLRLYERGQPFRRAP